MKALFQASKSAGGTSAIQSVEMEGAGALVTVDESLTLVIPSGQKGKYNTVCGEGRFRESWIQRDRRWLVRRSESLGGTMTVDGHMVPG